MEEVRQKRGGLGLKYRKPLGILLRADHVPDENRATENFAQRSGCEERQGRECVMGEWGLLSAVPRFVVS